MHTEAMIHPEGRVHSLGDLSVGLVMAEPHTGVRVRITGITPGALVPDGPRAGQPILTYAAIGIEPVDQLAGWGGPAAPQTVGGSWLVGTYRVVRRHGGWSTPDWYAHHVAPRVAEADRPALRRVWLGA